MQHREEESREDEKTGWEKLRELGREKRRDKVRVTKENKIESKYKQSGKYKKTL